MKRNIGLFIIFFVSGVCLVILSSGTAWAVWCGTSECTNCGSHNWSKREECKFDSKDACDKEIARIKWEVNAGVYTCYEKGSGGGTSGGLSTDSTTNIVQGIMNNNSQQFGIGLFGAILNDASRRNSAESARQAKEAQDRAEELRLANEKALLKQHDDMKNRLLGGMLNVSDSSQLGLMGAETGTGLSLMTDVKETRGTFGQEELKPIIGDAGPVPLLRQPGEIENQKGGRYIDCDSTRQFYDKASSGLNSQKDAIERTRTQIADAKKAKLEDGKKLRKVLLKGAYDTARDMLWTNKMLRERIGRLKTDGMSLEQRKTLLKAMKSLEIIHDRIEKGTQAFFAGYKFPEEFKNAKDIEEQLFSVNALLADSGIYEEGGKIGAGSFGPMGLLLYDASKLSLDAGVVMWEKEVLDENDLQQAQNTYDNLKYQLGQTQEKLDNAKSDLAKHCGSGQGVVLAP